MFINRNILLASTALTLMRGVTAFNSSGWKKDANGALVLDGDGNPIYVDGSGAEKSVKHDTISALNGESQGHRQRAEKLQADLDKYKAADGKLIDPTVAVKAIETVGKIDAKALIDAGEVDKVRQQITSEFQSQMAEKDVKNTELNSVIKNMKIDAVFTGSKFIVDNVAMPAEFFKAAMRDRFDIGDDGKIIVKDANGNRLMSKRTVGDFADPEEGLSLLVEQHPQRDVILKAPGKGGSGNGGAGAGGGNNNVRRLPRADFDALPAGQQSVVARDPNVEIVD